ncbi:MAG: protein kinase [Clostridiaceae bacterium]|nr:protein kinase [Eubacteriales bacterium]
MTGTILSQRYRILSLVGSGGMANVYKAVDQKTNRVVALKVLKDEHLEDADFLRRFEREAQAVLSLSHENIVRSYDVGEDDGVPYIVLEYVEGSTVKEILAREGALSPRVAVSVASQVLSALSHAHGRGIIHRDVKPQNVIITPSGRAKLADFGIARDVASTTRTFAGTNVIGSVHYLSPEQARGDEVTAESDIYSCGIMLYEMLLGTVPFAGENSVAIALKHLNEEITPPMEVDPKISRALSDIIVKATSKKPSMRYHTAGEMREDLQRALREPHGRFARVKNKDKEMLRHHRYGILNIALMVVVAIGLFASLFFIIRASRDGDDADTDSYVIPTVVGKNVDDATGLAKLRGFELFVQSEQASTQHPEGVILNQEPLGGTRGKPGDVINVVVSTGSDRAVVPYVLGMTLADATIEIEEQSLKVGGVEYVESGQPDGLVLSQNPPEGTELSKNDGVDLTISGVPGQSIEMPNVTGDTVTEALSALNEDGFNHIWLRFELPSAGRKEEVVFKQNPSAAMDISPATTVELWVYRSMLGEYSTDIAENVDVADTEQTVTVTVTVREGLELVLYEAVLPVGAKQPVSFTGYIKSGGEYPYTVYLNGVVIHESTAVFARKK